MMDPIAYFGDRSVMGDVKYSRKGMYRMADLEKDLVKDEAIVVSDLNDDVANDKNIESNKMSNASTEHDNQDNVVEQIEQKTDLKNHTNEMNSETQTSSTYPSGKKMTKFEIKKRRKEIISKAFSITVWVVGVLLMLMCLNNVYQKVFNPSGYTGLLGMGSAVVASNSMKPELHKDDLIFYRETPAEEIDKRDIIVYEKRGSDGAKMLVVHRVVNIGDGYVTTQGDANAVPDEAFTTSAIIGKYMFRIPKIGALLALFSTPWAFAFIAALIVVIFVVRISSYYIRKKLIIKKISDSGENRNALSYFFDI